MNRREKGLTPMFKPHDIRGKYGSEVSLESFYRVGQATAHTMGMHALTARDYRQHHDELEAAFIAGFEEEGGVAHTRLGVVPSPLACHSSKTLGIMFTASHNPSGYVGAKLFLSRTFASENQMSELKNAFDAIGNAAVPHSFSPLHPTPDATQFIDAYEKSLPPIGEGIFDLAGGAVCSLAHLFEDKIFDSPDPAFSHHSAEPKDETLGVLKEQTLARKKIGYAFDGDGDRLLAVDQGRVIEGHVIACFIAHHTLKKNDKVVLSIDCASEAFTWLRDNGYAPVYAKVGDTNMVETALSCGAKLGAERSGHYTFPPQHAYADGLRAAALVCQHARAGELVELSKQFKNVTVIEAAYHRADFNKMKEMAQRERGVREVITLDGVKAIFDEYTLLIRASNTEPKIRLNSEAKNDEWARKGMEVAKKWVDACRIK